MVYFDNNATTPLGQSALASYTLALEQNWQNPSSPYRASIRAKALLEQARFSLADSLGIKKEEITFTSGATEANNAVFAHFGKTLNSSEKCLLSPFEHSSVIESAKYWFKGRVHFMQCDHSGMVDLDEVEQCLDQKDISLVSLMAANNESGILQPWRELAGICSQRGIHFHCDATQWIGKLPLRDISICSSFSASAHKFSGPKGVGWLASKYPIQMQIGGVQEGSLRGGTENLPGIISMLTAWEEIALNLSLLDDRYLWRNQFEIDLERIVPYVKILGGKVSRLWNTSLFIVPKYENLSWVGKLDKLGFSVSTGSACSTHTGTSSSIISAMGMSENESRRLIRVSSYFDQTESDWSNLAQAFGQAYEELGIEASKSSVISI
jgi:cysteine desulfurase